MDVSSILTGDTGYPEVQEITPVVAQLGFSLTFTPYLSSGLPTTPISITDALVAEVMKTSPVVKENFTYIFGMASAMIPMPRIGRNVYTMSGNIVNAVPSFGTIYSFLMLLSNANSLILGRTELVSGSVTAPQTLTMANSAIYERPPFLGIVAGATEAQQISEPISILGSIDFTNTSIGDGLTNLTATLSNFYSSIEDITDLVTGG